jgi:hypothetical protein
MPAANPEALAAEAVAPLPACDPAKLGAVLATEGAGAKETDPAKDADDAEKEISAAIAVATQGRFMKQLRKNERTAGSTSIK